MSAILVEVTETWGALDADRGERGADGRSVRAGGSLFTNIVATEATHG